MMLALILASNVVYFALGSNVVSLALVLALNVVSTVLDLSLGLECYVVALVLASVLALNIIFFPWP